MKFEIKSRWNSTLLFTCEAASLGLAVMAAVKARADLSRADLFCADLSYADLSYADLSRANLSRADLFCADLSYADLSYADLSRADLSRADLSYADLSHADLSHVDLSHADLSRADLSGVNNAELAQAQTSILPEGDIIGWTQCENGVIVKLFIGQKTRRSNATGRKCRAESAKVLRVFGATEGISIYGGKTVYRKGETVICDKWNENRFDECGGGIHFYITRIEAEKQ